MDISTKLKSIKSFNILKKVNTPKLNFRKKV